MGRWCAFTWDDGTVWGVDATDTLLWALEVDWDGDGVYDGQNECWCLTDVSIERGRRYFVTPDGTGLEPMEVGRLTATLYDDGRYNPFNPLSPIYPVEPGRHARLRVKNTIDGTLADVFAGVVENMRPYRENDRDYVEISIVDGWEYLRRCEINTAAYTNKRTDEALAIVLSAADWPVEWGSDLGTGSITLGYWWASTRTAAEAISTLILSERGRFALLASGQARFRGRTDHDDSILTIQEADCLKEVGLLQPWETVRNVVRVLVYPRTLGSISVLWTMGVAALIRAGQSLTLTANYMYDGKPTIAMDMVTPVSSTDYQANTQADGLGVDLTGDFSVTVDATYAGSQIMTITNGGVSDGYLLATFQVRGKPLSDACVTMIEKDVSAGTTKRTFIIDSQHIQTITSAIKTADDYANLLGVVRRFPIIQLLDRPDIQYAFDLTDKVTLNIPSLGIFNEEYRVGYIEHQWQGPTGQAVLTTVQFEPFVSAGTSTAWVWPITWGISMWQS